jgi:hypothetical protein
MVRSNPVNRLGLGEIGKQFRMLCNNRDVPGEPDNKKAAQTGEDIAKAEETTMTGIDAFCRQLGYEGEQENDRPFHHEAETEHEAVTDRIPP